MVADLGLLRAQERAIAVAERPVLVLLDLGPDRTSRSLVGSRRFRAVEPGTDLVVEWAHASVGSYRGSLSRHVSFV